MRKTKVRKHERKTPSGRITTVRSHYRKVPSADFGGIEGDFEEDLKPKETMRKTLIEKLNNREELVSELTTFIINNADSLILDLMYFVPQLEDLKDKNKVKKGVKGVLAAIDEVRLDNEHVRIFRVLNIDHEEIENTIEDIKKGNVGDYWSFHDQAIEGLGNIKLEAKVKINDLDLIASTMKQMEEGFVEAFVISDPNAEYDNARGVLESFSVKDQDDFWEEKEDKLDIKILWKAGGEDYDIMTASYLNDYFDLINRIKKKALLE